MRTVYQDCGCVSLPDEIVLAMRLYLGSVLDISYSADLVVATLSVIDPAHNIASEMPTASCRVRTVGA